MRLFRRRTTKSDDAAGRDLERAVEAERRRLHSEESDTEGQWRMLEASIRTDDRPLPVVRKLRPAIALGLAAAAVVVAVVLEQPSSGAMALETGRGEQTVITLADSTQITLSHTTTLSITASGRMATLRGEAYFRVRPGAEPFTVATDMGAVRVLGTEFNVRRRGDRLEVAVVKGRVEVSGGGRAVMLGAGERTARRGDGPFAGPSPLGHDRYPGWLHGRLHIERATLAEVCREIEDRFAVSVRLEGGADATLTGSLDAASADAALRTLARLTGRTFTHDESGYTLH